MRGGPIDSASSFLRRRRPAEGTRCGEDSGKEQLHRSTPLIPWLLPIAWALLLAAWVLTNPPFAAPDESAHYLRAVGLSEEHLIGQPVPQAEIGLTKRQRAWTRQAARLIRVPTGLDPEPYGCEVANEALSAACLEAARPNRAVITLATPVGNYQPLPYLLPALLMRSAHTAPGALRIARAGGALVSWVLLTVALLASYDGAYPVLSILGVLLAVTPMTLFCAASLGGSGLEISSGIAFTACLLRITRPVRIRRRWWIATALSGAVLSLSRTTGPLWLLLALCTVVAWATPRRSLMRWGHMRWAWRAAGLLAVALILNRLWEYRYGSHLVADTTSLRAGLSAGARSWWTALPELVGKFGYVDVKLPLVLPALWLGLTLGLVSAAARSTRRERILMAALLIASLVLPPAFYALFMRPTGFGLQGRHLLPCLVILPLLAGEIYHRRQAHLAARQITLLTAGAALSCALIQASAWYVNAKHYAVGNSGSTWFDSGAKWKPPGGWAIWMTIVGISAAIMAALPAIERRALRQSATMP